MKIGIVAFAFGVPCIIRSNQFIAYIASWQARNFGAPVYTQLDVCIEPGIEVQYTDEQADSPPSTLQIARGAIQWAKHLGFTELWIVAAKPHLWRCIRDLTYAVQEAGVQIRICVCQEIEHYPEDQWFCLASTQERTRSKQGWQKRERFLKLLPMWVYKHVAN